jgi:hypothetical protein
VEQVVSSLSSCNALTVDQHNHILSNVDKHSLNPKYLTLALYKAPELTPGHRIRERIVADTIRGNKYFVSN